MQRKEDLLVSQRGPLLAVMVCVVSLAACTAPPPTQDIYDPNEAANREVHDFNKAIDTALVKPISGAFSGRGEPGPISRVVANFADNLSEPSRVVNSLLQGNIPEAAQSSLRFAFNSTFGLAGILDPSTALGVQVKDTDFGETLHVWGVGEGAYVEVPLAGPSTERDVVGMAVDFLINPVSILLDPPQSYVATVAGLASKVGDRGRFSDTVDSILYDSADSYAQARLLYLQNRRFELGQTASDDNFEDPYAQ
jgi:phospholipid-binding lipoprotein MlaA